MGDVWPEVLVATDCSCAVACIQYAYCCIFYTPGIWDFMLRNDPFRHGKEVGDEKDSLVHFVSECIDTSFNVKGTCCLNQ